MSALSPTLNICGAGWDRLSRLRDALDLIAAVRELRDPFASPAEFRKLVALVVRLSELFGLDPAWLERWESLLTDDRLVAVVLAMAHYVIGVLDRHRADSYALIAVQEATSIDAQSYADWLPLVIELVRLLQRLRGAV